MQPVTIFHLPNYIRDDWLDEAGFECLLALITTVPELVRFCQDMLDGANDGAWSCPHRLRVELDLRLAVAVLAVVKCAPLIVHENHMGDAGLPNDLGAGLGEVPHIVVVELIVLRHGRLPAALMPVHAGLPL
jgi:hypothetical protein